MSLTLTEISEKLESFDEVLILELLDISSEDLINRFQDFIEEKIDQLEEEVC